MGKAIAVIIGNITRRAGTERAVANLVNMLSQNTAYGVHILSLYSCKEEACSYPVSPKVRVKHLGLAECGLLQRGLLYIKAVCYIRDYCRRFQIDIVVGTTHALNCLLVLLGDARKIACEHMNYSACPYPARVARRLVYPWLDAVVLLTKADANQYRFIAENKKYVIPNSLPFHRTRPASLEEKNIVAVGRLTRQKGFDMLVQAAIRIKKRAKGWCIHIYGEGEEKGQLVRMIRQHQLEDFIKIHAPVNDMEEIFRTSSIFVLPSRWEGLPMVLLESQACGLPAVSFRCPHGPAEIIKDGVNGFLIAPGDIDGFSKKLLQLMQDGQSRKVLGGHAFRMAARYEDIRILGKWEKVFSGKTGFTGP